MFWLSKEKNRYELFGCNANEKFDSVKELYDELDDMVRCMSCFDYTSQTIEVCMLYPHRKEVYVCICAIRYNIDDGYCKNKYYVGKFRDDEVMLSTYGIELKW